MKLEKQMKNSSYRKGFTLIELLITIAMLGGMVSIILVKYPASVQRARDVQRQADLKSYQNALELYAMKHNGLYPTSGNIPIPTLCPILGMNGDSCREDPKGGTYYYESDTNGKNYTTWSSLEKSEDTFVACSGGKSGLAMITPASGSCPTFNLTANPTSAATPVPTSAPTATPTPAATNTPSPTPLPVTILNSKTGKTCQTICNNQGKTCISIGIDSQAINTQYYKYVTSCQLINSGGIDGCFITMDNKAPQKCPSGGTTANWTNCRCQ